MTHRDAVQQIAAAPIAVVALLERFPIPRAAAYVRRDDDISETHEELCDRIVRVGLVTALGLAGSTHEQRIGGGSALTHCADGPPCTITIPPALTASAVPGE